MEENQTRIKATGKLITVSERDGYRIDYTKKETVTTANPDSERDGYRIDYTKKETVTTANPDTVHPFIKTTPVIGRPDLVFPPDRNLIPIVIPDERSTSGQRVEYIIETLENTPTSYENRGDQIDIDIRYVRDGMKPIDYAGGPGVSDWIDLRSGIDVELQPMERCNIPLGVAMKLPDGYEAHIEARSSTYRNFKIIRINSGVIDNSYCGNDDEWHFEALALEHTIIHKNDRICQFRVMKNQPRVMFHEVDALHGKNRGGSGTTGYK